MALRIEMDDYYIRDLIKIARDMLHAQNAWLDAYGDECISKSPPSPMNWQHYFRIRGIIRDVMKWRRAHRKAVNHIWTVFTEDVIAKRAKKAGV